MATSLTRAWMMGSSAGLAALLLGACVPPPASDRATAGGTLEKPGDAADSAIAARPKQPDVAFLIEGDLYAVPLAVDGDGCEQFTTWSKSGVRSLTQPIYFLDGQGSFTPTKLDAYSCNAEMVETGSDETGCPKFEAKQPDGTSSRVIYYPAQSGYTVHRDRSSCG